MTTEAKPEDVASRGADLYINLCITSQHQHDQPLVTKADQLKHCMLFVKVLFPYDMFVFLHDHFTHMLEMAD